MFVGITQDDQLYSISVSGGDYFSVTANKYDVFTNEVGKEMAENMLEFGDLWRMAVENDQTEKGKEEYNKQLLDTAGWREIVGDISDIYTVNGTEYNLKLVSTGQCIIEDTEELKELFIDEEIYKKIVEMWEEYHLESDYPEVPELPEQDLSKLHKQAIEQITQ